MRNCIILFFLLFTGCITKGNSSDVSQRIEISPKAFYYTSIPVGVFDTIPNREIVKLYKKNDYLLVWVDAVGYSGCPHTYYNSHILEETLVINIYTRDHCEALFFEDHLFYALFKHQDITSITIVDYVSSSPPAPQTFTVDSAVNVSSMDSVLSDFSDYTNYEESNSLQALWEEFVNL